LRCGVGASLKPEDDKKKMKSLFYFTVAALAIAPLAGFAQTLMPSQDAFYVPGSATNYGAATTITVGSSGSVGLVQFDLTQLPAGVTAAQIQKATLTLFLDHVGVGGTFNIDTVSASTPWTESTVNGLSGISPGVAVATAVPATTAFTYITVDATAAVQSWLSGTTNNGFLLTGNFDHQRAVRQQGELQHEPSCDADDLAVK
jgi:hypothetical protein